MSAHALHGLRLRHLTPSSFAARTHRAPSASRVFSTALALDDTRASTSDPSPRDLLLAAKKRDLLSSLQREDPNPSRPWTHYIDLLNYMGLDTLPLEIHQLVLRKCVPSARAIRTSSARERRIRYQPHAPHAYENRLQTVMRNIRTAGWQAELDDYHFILEQFAAVGHYVGSRRILREMAAAGVEPRVKTYGLCLQALAHRLTLPCSEEQRPALVAETTKMCRDLIRDMWVRKVPFTSVNMDLVLRTLRETVDEKGFEDLIKFAYGIDLAYPDRLPLEVVQRTTPSTTELSEPSDSSALPLQPLSTPVLNTIVDMLGRTGRISKMVQAFEVLSQPLPKSDQVAARLFDEDEDDYPVNPPSNPGPHLPLPFAPPNTTTFQYLLMHAAQADHAVLARHYLAQAMRADRQQDVRLKSGMRTLPVEEIMAPTCAVNRNMFLSVFGLSNRQKHTELMRWTSRMIKRTLRVKRKDLLWYTYKRTVRYYPGVQSDVQEGIVDSAVQAASLPPIDPLGDSQVDTTVDHSTATPSSSAVPQSTPSTSRPAREGETPIFDLDLDSEHLYSPRPPSTFNIGLHISLLQRDIEQLQRLDAHVEAVLGRTIHRIKERLGRRVWSGKDIWLADVAQRVPVSKGFWRTIVNFVIPRLTRFYWGRNQDPEKRR
ncbi:hypothetical protein BC834DRAFT_619677 [Gloeopeniophorella convolvens]|nr:hypothetical protein BC834DRAFT_619677 [Gloeopeniophorella convolvens]